jgi:hypothetical protein
MLFRPVEMVTILGNRMVVYLVDLTVSLKVAKMAELMAESLDISMAAMMERSTVLMLVTRRAAE